MSTPNRIGGRRFDDPEEHLSSGYHGISEDGVEDTVNRCLRGFSCHAIQRDALHWLEWQLGRATMMGEPQPVRDALAQKWRIIRDVHETNMLVSATGPAGVYVVYAENCDAVKIGWSENIPRRLRQLQTGNPNKLSLLVILGALQDHEFALHRRFSALRIDKGSEWFSLHPVLQKYIDSRSPEQVNESMRA